MVSHEIFARGVSLEGIAHARPTLLSMHSEDFPARFFAGLAAMPRAPAARPAAALRTITIGAQALALAPVAARLPMVAAAPLSSASSVQLLPDLDSAPPLTLYQPVHRLLHVVLLQLNCNTLGSPRLDPTKILSAGVVIRRVVRIQGADRLDKPPSQWTRTADGQLSWVVPVSLPELQDPDPNQRPQPPSGQLQLNRLLASQALASATAEISTPAFVAPPAVCDASGRTLLFAVIPTASSEASTNGPPTPQYDPAAVRQMLPYLLRAGPHSAPAPDRQVDYRNMSDDFSSAQLGGLAGPFLKFTAGLRLLHTVFGAFGDDQKARDLITALNGYSVHMLDGSDSTAVPMGSFYQQAAAALIDYDPMTDAPPTSPLVMPHAWDPFSEQDAADILARLTALLQNRSSQVTAPSGRFQDPSRLYRLRVFVRIKGDMPGCPPLLVWSAPSAVFRIAAWHEGAGRTQPPVPLPDPFDPKFRKSVQPNCSFAVPARLMNAMQGTSLSGLTSGAGPPAGGVALNWICGFNIPLITICAFFVLNIFLMLLNIVFFWLPLIKICIPFPASTSASQGDTDGT
jgi:hypothetical protein